MAGRFVTSPDLIGKWYDDVADFPYDKPIAQDENHRCVYKGRRKVYLVVDGKVLDYFDWDIYGSDGRDTQIHAQRVWGIKWHIS